MKLNFNYKNINKGGNKLKNVIFNVVNVVLLVILFFILNNIPKVATTVKQLRSESIVAQEEADISILSSELKRYQEKIDEVNSKFTNEDKFINFLQEVENIKRDGVLGEFSFPVSQTVKDSNGNFGFPVSFVFQGSQEQINSEVLRLLNLDFLIKPINVEVEVSSGSEIITLRMGSFLYVNEEFKK